MADTPTGPLSDSSIRALVQFDETLRAGRTPMPAGPIDPELDETRRFLVRLQSLWPRTQRQRIGNYTLTRTLGQGTLGTTYLTEASATARPFILKVLWPTISDDAPTREKLTQAAIPLMTARGAGIAAVKEVFQVGRVTCIVTEYCAGVSLAHWRLKNPQPLDGAIAVEVLAKIADILDAAHRQGLAHGNLKPTNIFLAHPSEISNDNVHRADLRIADFALANVVWQTKLAANGGLPWPMPQYLALEHLRHRYRPAAPAGDLYALGVLGYELLTGRLPIKGTTRDEVAAATRDATPPSPRVYRADLPPGLEEVIMQCLQRSARKRPPSARRLSEALRASVNTNAAHPAWWQRWLKWD
jgi:serine/threonine-protein kinase